MLTIPCYDFGPARVRPSPTSLAPPLTRVLPKPLVNVGYLPLHEDGRIFLSHTNGELVAYDAGAFAPLWTHTFGERYQPLASMTGACVLVEGAVVLFAGKDLVVLDPATGHVRERVALEGFDLWSAAIVGPLLVGQRWDGGRKLTAFHLGERRIVWQRPITSPTGMVAAADGVACRFEGAFAAGGALDTGEDRWTYSVEELGQHTDVLGDHQPGTTVGRPIVWEGALLLAVRAHHVVSLDLATGTPRWIRRVAAQNPSTLTAYEGKLLVLGEKTLETLDARTGDLLSERDLSAELARVGAAGPMSRPAVTDEHLYCGDGQRGVLGIERATGRVAWREHCKARVPLGYAPVVLGPRLYVVDSAGCFQVWAH